MPLLEDPLSLSKDPFWSDGFSVREEKERKGKFIFSLVSNVYQIIKIKGQHWSTAFFVHQNLLHVDPKLQYSLPVAS